MKDLFQNFKININETIYLKDPESSELGKRILKYGILLIDEIGFENFTFKKLGIKIKSNESSIYRYFENKHNFLVYITNWYWGWKEFQLVLSTQSIQDPMEKLLKAVDVMAQPVEEDIRFEHINEVALNNIIINESSKSYLTKKVDEENKHGHFVLYKRLVKRVSEMITDVHPEYEYPFSLSTTLIDGSLHQHFLAKHFHSISDHSKTISPADYFRNLVLSTVN